MGEIPIIGGENGGTGPGGIHVFGKPFDHWKALGKFWGIVQRAFKDAGIPFEQAEEIMRWAVGDDYKTLPFESWCERMKQRLKFPRHADIYNATVYSTFRAVCQIWKESRPIYGR